MHLLDILAIILPSVEHLLLFIFLGFYLVVQLLVLLHNLSIHHSFEWTRVEGVSIII